MNKDNALRTTEALYDPIRLALAGAVGTAPWCPTSVVTTILTVALQFAEALGPSVDLDFLAMFVASALERLPVSAPIRRALAGVTVAYVESCLAENRGQTATEEKPS